MDFDLLVQQIRTVFFPRWDAKREWCIVEAEGDDLQFYGGVHGRCEYKKKTITINWAVLARQSIDENRLLLIHEIAHAAVGGGHGKKWRSRMERAAQKAQSIGMHQLGTLVSNEVKIYREGDHRHISEIVYEMIVNAVNDSERHIKFEDLFEWVSWQVAVVPDQLLKICKQARASYDKAVREKERVAKLKEAFISKLSEPTP